MKRILTFSRHELAMLLLLSPLLIQLSALDFQDSEKTMIWILGFGSMLHAGLYWAYLYVLGDAIQQLLPDHRKMNSVKFKRSIRICFVLLVPVIAYSCYAGYQIVGENIFVYLLMPLFFLLMILLVLSSSYVYFFIAKGIRMLETNGIVKIRDYCFTMLLLWVPPIGILILPARIYRLFDQKTSVDSSTDQQMG